MEIQDLVSIREILSLAVAPNGKYIAFQLVQPDANRNEYGNDWYVAPFETHAESKLLANAGPVQIFRTAYGNVHGGLAGWPAAWSPDSQWLTFLKEVDGVVQIWRASFEGGTEEQLTQNAANVVDFIWVRDGTAIYFAVGFDRARKAKEYANESKRGFLFDERFRPIYSSRPLWNWCEPKQRRLSRLDRISVDVGRCEQAVWVYDFESGEERPAIESEAKTYWERRRTNSAGQSTKNSESVLDGDSVRGVISSPVDKRVAWLENMDPENNPGLFPPLTVSVSKTWERTDPIRCMDALCTGRIEKLWWREKTGEVIFRRWESDETRLDGTEVTRPSVSMLLGWRPGDESVRTILSTDDLFQLCQMVGDSLVCLYDSWTQPPRLAAIQLGDGGLATIFDPNPGFASIDFTEVEKLVVSNEQGYKAIGHLVYPVDFEEGQRYPLAIVSYVCTGSSGSSFLRGGTGDELPIHVMAQHGFAVLCFSMPLFPRGNSSLPFLELMIDELVERGIVDERRIGISGLSGGGILVEEALVNSSRFTAAHAAWSPTHPANYYFIPYASSRQMMRREAGGEAIFGGLNYWSENSPGVRASLVTTPLLLQVADVEIDYAIPNYYSLVDAGKPVEMYVFPDEYHIKTQPAHKFAVYKRNLQWFKFWLQGVEEPDPLDPKQYERWRMMRENHCSTMKADGESPLPVYCGTVN